VHLCIFDESPGLDLGLHLLLAHKVIVHSVLLSFPRPPRRVAHAEAERRRVLLLQQLDQRPLPHSRRSRYHQRLRPCGIPEICKLRGEEVLDCRVGVGEVVVNDDMIEEGWLVLGLQLRLRSR